MLELSNCYKILHLEQGCSDLQLRQKYRKIALELHPDKQKPQDSYSQKDNRFVKVNQAYRQITNHRKQKNSQKKFKITDNQSTANKHVKLLSFEEIMKKIGNLNKIIYQTTSQLNYSSKIGKEIDSVYDEHFKIMQKMSEKLRIMRQK